MPVSLRQIAEKSGMSMSTVSRVLRGNTNYSEQTQKKILQIADELAYRPNLLVRGMQSGRTKTLGVMVPPRGEFLSRVVMGIHDYLAEHDHVPLFHWAKLALPEREQIHRLVDRRVDGIILFTTADTATDTYLEEIWKRGLPAVTVDRRMPNTHADFVGTDDHLGGQLAAEHLLELGHRRLVYYARRIDISTARERWEGFKEAASRCEGAVATLIDSTDNSYGDLPPFLDSPDRPTAVFANNDRMAFKVIRAATNLGLKVPRDLSVMGFADLDIATHTTPQLSTFRQDAELIGRTAAQLVLDRLDGQLTDATPQVIQFPPELIARDSTTHAPQPPSA